MAASKISHMIDVVVLDRPHECPGFYCVELENERYPMDGVHYISSTGVVPTYICLHYPGMC